MRHWIMATAILVPLSTGMNTSGSGPEEVEVTLSGDVKVKGEILAVRESSIVMATRFGLSEEELMQNPKQIVVVRNERIAKVETPSSSYIGLGVLGGLAVGCGAGCAIGSEMVKQEKNDILGCNALAEQSNNMIAGSMIGGLAGTAVGAVVGAAVSEKGIVITGASADKLKALARYQDGEPEFLRAIGR